MDGEHPMPQEIQQVADEFLRRLLGDWARWLIEIHNIAHALILWVGHQRLIPAVDVWRVRDELVRANLQELPLNWWTWALTCPWVNWNEFRANPGQYRPQAQDAPQVLAAEDQEPFVYENIEALDDSQTVGDALEYAIQTTARALAWHARDVNNQDLTHHIDGIIFMLSDFPTEDEDRVLALQGVRNALVGGLMNTRINALPQGQQQDRMREIVAALITLLNARLGAAPAPTPEVNVRRGGPRHRRRGH